MPAAITAATKIDKIFFMIKPPFVLLIYVQFKREILIIKSDLKCNGSIL